MDIVTAVSETLVQEILWCSLYIYVYINPFIDKDDVIAILFWSALLRNLPPAPPFNIHIKWHHQSACHLWKLFPRLPLASSFVCFISQLKCHFLQDGFPDCRLIWSAFSASVTTLWEQFSGLINTYLSDSFLSDCFSHWTVNLMRTEGMPVLLLWHTRHPAQTGKQ